MFFLDFEVPLASIWVPMDSLFGIAFSTLFLKVKMNQNSNPPPKWPACGKGGAGSGVLGITHLGMLEEVIMWF